MRDAGEQKLKLYLGLMFAIGLSCAQASPVMLFFTSDGAIPIGNYSQCLNGDFTGAWVWIGGVCTQTRISSASSGDNGSSSSDWMDTGNMVNSDIRPLFTMDPVAPSAWMPGPSLLLVAGDPSDKKTETSTTQGAVIEQQFTDPPSSTSVSSPDHKSDAEDLNAASTDVTDTAIPEPGTLLFAGVGMVVAAVLLRRKIRRT